MFPAPEPSSGCRNRRRAGLWEGMPGRARKARSREEVGVDHPNRGRPPEVAEGSRRPGARHGDAENAAVRVTAAAAGRLVVRLGGPAIYAGPMVSQGVRCREAESPDHEHCGQCRSRGTAAPGFVHGTEGYPGTARTQPEPTTRGSTRPLAPASPALVFISSVRSSVCPWRSALVMEPESTTSRPVTPLVRGDGRTRAGSS